MKRLNVCFFVFLFTTLLKAQPYVDLINVTGQFVNAAYKDSAKGINTMYNIIASVSAPVKLDSQNVLIIRVVSDNIHTNTIVESGTRVPFANITANNDVSYANNFYAVILPIGLQHQTKNQKWKFLLLAMPKIAGSNGYALTKYNFQPGVYSMITRKVNENLSLKGGLFYNREFFGNFFVHIVSVDWRVNSKFQMYGTFPTFYKFEYQITKHKRYVGISYKSYTRSFLLPGSDHNYMRINDMSVKAFIDIYIKKKFLLFFEMGVPINYSLLDYYYNTKTEIVNSVIYRKSTSKIYFNVGLAYRLRFDFNKD